MHVSTSAGTAAFLLVSSLSSAFATIDSSVCGLTVTCAQNVTTTTSRVCSVSETRDFQRVSTSLQACKDVSYNFSQGQPWPINDKPFFCAEDAVCGKLVPYLRNTPYLTDMCEAFVPFADTIATFIDYCRGEPIHQIAGDNGIMRDPTLGNATAKPTPAPTGNEYYQIESIEPPVSTPSYVISKISGAMTPIASGSMLMVVVVVVLITI